MIREFDEKGLMISSQQGNLFMESINTFSGSSYSFIKTFMNSDIVMNIDNTNEINTSSIIEDLNKYKSIKRGNIKMNPDVIYWIGYIYRYWAYVYNESSKRIYEIADAKQMERIYEPYHTMDPRKAIERIYEDNNISIEIDQVSLMRKIIFGK